MTKGGLEEVVALLLGKGGRTVAVAESCTGGMLGHRLTSVSGSSAYFLGGVIAYANAAKMRELNVDSRVLETEGAVSEPVARQMALGVRRRFEADLGVGITGIAGPTGGSPDKPVGLVYVALAHAGGCRVERFRFAGDRLAVKTAAGDAALRMMEQYLESEGADHGQEDVG